MLVYFLLAVGLALLLLGGEWLVKGAVGMAQKLHIPPLIIGLTIVAFGTSAPELLVSLRAALGGDSGIALGNVVGSNIANVLLVLGLPALFAAIVCKEDGIRANMVILSAVTVLFIGMLIITPLSRLDGMILLGVLVAFLAYQFYQMHSRKPTPQSATEPADELLDDVGEIPTNGLTVAAYLVAGLVALPLAAELTVSAAVDIAEIWGVPSDVIGLTIVAIGTSLPELATAIMAARAASTSVLLGSVIGSNLFNIAGILGITALVVPLSVSEKIMDFDIWVMLAATAFLGLVAVTRLTIGRLLGAVLFGAYLAYLVATVML